MAQQEQASVGWFAAQMLSAQVAQQVMQVPSPAWGDQEAMVTLAAYPL
jgi:hypothetical protein